MMKEDVDKMIAAGKLPANQSNSLLALSPGTVCLHPSFGIGKIVSWDTLGDRIVVDFPDKPAHPMGLRIAIKTLKPLAEDHILAQFLANPTAIRELAAGDPVAFVGSVLRSANGALRFDEFEFLVKDRIIPEANYKKWWDNAKKHLRGHREFVIPSKRTEPLQLRVSNLSPAELLVEDFDLARDLKEKARLLGEMRKHLDFFKAPSADLSPVIENAGDVAMKSQKLNPGGAIELMLARDALASAIKGFRFPENAPNLAALVKLEIGHLAEALKNLSASASGDVADALPAAFGETWAEKALQLLDGCGAKAFGEIASRLCAGDAAPIFALWIRRGLSQRSHSPEALGWICTHRTGLAEPFFGQEVGLAILEAIDRAFTSSGTTRGNRALDVMQNDKTLIHDLLGVASENEVRAFAKRLMATPAIDDLTRRSLLARVIKSHALVLDMVDGDNTSSRDESLIVSWESLERKRAELDDLVRVQIPDNTRQIAIAREHGDLRENFEFKSAKQMQSVLERRKIELEQEISNARGTDYTDADPSSVAIGTVATVRFSDTNTEEEIAILGAWDSDPSRKILSYLSEVGQAMLGRVPGDSVTLPSEIEGVIREGTILSIRRWLEAPID